MTGLIHFGRVILQKDTKGINASIVVGGEYCRVRMENIYAKNVITIKKLRGSAVNIPKFILKTPFAKRQWERSQTTTNTGYTALRSTVSPLRIARTCWLQLLAF